MTSTALRTWRETVHIVTGFVLALTAACFLLTLAALTVGLAVTVLPALVTLVTMLGCAQIFGQLQRARFAALLGVRIEPTPYRVSALAPTKELLAEARGDVWRQVGYHLVALPLATAGFVVVIGAWSVALAFIPVALYAWALPQVGLFGADLHGPLGLAALTAVGLAALFAAPWLTRVIVLADVTLARALLGPSRTQQLARRVETLTESRAGVVDAADAERRRIERDLHDGTQQRLVSLAMNLGVARATLPPGPEREAVEQAHDEAKQALKELRDFVRGLHPAVLNDQGLDAALSGIAARSPLPVRLSVDLPIRPSPTIEAVAFFVVSEALTNAAKHARAARAEVTVETVGDRLLVVISDDGRGGADLDGGTGLRGLAQRAASVDGSLSVDSPPGGPTLIMVELPCES